MQAGVRKVRQDMYLYATGSLPVLYCLYCFSKVPSGLCRTMGLSAAVVYRRTECCPESITLALSVRLHCRVASCCSCVHNRHGRSCTILSSSSYACKAARHHAGGLPGRSSSLQVAGLYCSKPHSSGRKGGAWP